MTKKYYYYTGPVEADAMGRRSPEDRATAKAVVRKMHDYLRFLIENQPHQEGTIKRLDDELNRRAGVGSMAVARVLRCSVAELDLIGESAFSELPDILVVTSEDYN